MTEENDPQKSEEAKPEELESLVGGLDLTPDWAKGDPGVTQTPPERKGGRPSGPRAPRSSSRRGLQGVRVKPRRSDGGGRGGDRRSSGGPGGDFRGAPRRERPPRVPVHVDFIPEKKRLSKVVKVIRQSHRVYPLHVVAEKFMENPAFISMKYTVREKSEGAEDFYFYICKANGMVFTDEQACVQYVVEHGLEANYETETREVEPPKGNFVCVGRHRRSGRLIGPPNWHGYQARMEEVRQEVAEGTPPEVFSSDVEMVRDEEVIEAWKKEAATQTFYRRKLEEKERKKDAPSTSEAEKPNADASEETGETPEAAESTEASEASPSDQAEPETSDGEKTEASEPEEVAAEPETETESEPAEEPEAEEEPPAVEEEPVDDRPFDLTREQAEEEFKQAYLSRLVGKSKRAIMPGYLLPKMTDPSLESLTRYHLNRECHRPNSIIFALRPAFKHMRLQVFRYDGELMVGGMRQSPLPEDQNVTPEIRNIIDYVAAHPGCNTQEALQSVSNTTGEVPAETVSHFRWLIEKGHLLEFHDGTLHLPHGQKK